MRRADKNFFYSGPSLWPRRKPAGLLVLMGKRREAAPHKGNPNEGRPDMKEKIDKEVHKRGCLFIFSAFAP